MNKLTIPAALLSLTMLAGCSGQAADTTEVAPAEQATTAAPTDAPEAPGEGEGPGGQGGGPGGMPGGGGVSGLIAAVIDGVLQVQSSDSQTAVRHDTETAITRAATITVADLVAGSCVSGMASDGAVSFLTVTEPVDGQCEQGFGQMPSGERPDGGERPTDMPSDFPSGMPSDMPTDFPTDMPSDMPSMPEGEQGGPGGAGGFQGDPVSGLVASVEGNTLTLANGTTLNISEDAVISATVEAGADDLVVGVCVTAMGESDTSGGMDATSLRLSDPAEDGTCNAGGFGGGFPGGGRNG